MSKLVMWSMAGVLVASAGCARTPPPNWVEGGAPLYMQPARWTRDDQVIELRSDGRVMEDDDVLFMVDTAGRVYEDDGEPIAVLQHHGQLVGEDRVGLGIVGPTSASFPGSTTAWLSVGQEGEVIRYDEEGERSLDGHWEGCEGPASRTCTLISHMLLLDEWRRRPRVGVGVGVGFTMVR